jgi:hypothetical protein
MALIKTYSLGCDGPSLARRLGVNFTGAHVPQTPFPYAEAAKARRLAIKSGWTRVVKSFPIIVSDTSAGSTDIAFDLCPGCSNSFGKV